MNPWTKIDKEQSNWSITRNTFCGMRYLSHCHAI